MTSGCYILTNSITHKRYVGQSVRIEKRLRDHREARTNNLIHKSVKKHGFGAFEVKVWECPVEDLDELEEFLIAELDTVVPNGYNVTPGGSVGLRGFKHSPETRKRESESRKGKKHSDTTRAKMSAAHKRNYCPERYRKIGVMLAGIPRSKEVKDKISKAKMGHIVSHETRLKRSAQLKGKPWSDARREAQENKRVKL